MKKFTAWMALACAAGAVSGCGKSVSFLAKDVGNTGVETGPDSDDRDCELKSWEFTQSGALERKSADLLFVVDSSSSLASERAQVAADLPAFVEKLAAGADLRVGVMLAHGGASGWSGRLYSAAGVSPVLSTQAQSLRTIQDSLRATLAAPASDRDEADGEAMMYSLRKSLEPARLAEIQSQGFYRENAALSVVFVTDENDVCARPQDLGFSVFPDYVPSYRGIENVAYSKYCAGVSAETTLGLMKDFKTDQKLSWAGILHEKKDAVPQGTEDSIGHGILQLVQSSMDGVVVDLSEESYDFGLGDLGNIVSLQTEVHTAFGLGSDAAIEGESVRVVVDGNPVPAQYDPDRRQVEIRAGDAGAAGSMVQVSACVSR